MNENMSQVNGAPPPNQLEEPVQVSTGSGQPQPTMVPMSEVQAVVAELTMQRNLMSDRATNLAVQLRAAQIELETLRETLRGKPSKTS